MKGELGIGWSSCYFNQRGAFQFKSREFEIFKFFFVYKQKI